MSIQQSKCYWVFYSILSLSAPTAALKLEAVLVEGVTL